MQQQFKKNKLLKVLSLNSVAVAVNFVLGLCSTKIISVFLGTPGMALLGGFRNFSGMVKSVATLGANHSLIRLFIENKDDKKALSGLYSTFFWLFLMLSILLCGCLLIFAEAISRFVFFDTSYTAPIRFFALLLPLLVLNTFWLAIYNALEKFRHLILIQVIANVLIFVMTSVLIWKAQITGGLYAIAFSEVVMLLVTFFFIQKDKSHFQFNLQSIIDPKYFAVIWRFSAMAVLSAVLVPLVLMLIRNRIVATHSLEQAGIWDAVNRLSGFYMTVFSSGLSLYYLPKLASLTTDSAFRTELKHYFKVMVPLFLVMSAGLFLFRNWILQLAFSKEFLVIANMLIWQLAGDFIKIMTLAFGYQILVKTMLRKYFLVELVFNGTYLLLSYYLIQLQSVEGAIQAYFWANLASFTFILLIFRKVFSRSSAH